LIALGVGSALIVVIGADDGVTGRFVVAGDVGGGLCG
jgi:hypothetical protein